MQRSSFGLSAGVRFEWISPPVAATSPTPDVAAPAPSTAPPGPKVDLSKTALEYARRRFSLALGSIPALERARLLNELGIETFGPCMPRDSAERLYRAGLLSRDNFQAFFEDALARLALPPDQCEATVRIPPRRRLTLGTARPRGRDGRPAAEGRGAGLPATRASVPFRRS